MSAPLLLDPVFVSSRVLAQVFDVCGGGRTPHSEERRDACSARVSRSHLRLLYEESLVESNGIIKDVRVRIDKTG